MIPIRRLDEPEVLRKNKERWLATYLQQREQNPGLRPRSAQYAHDDIVSVLEAMSHHKCFYCEQSTKQTKCEVDHHVEIADQPALAFDWKNLYLACCDCNGHKKRHRVIPVADCLDPCDATVRPSDHLDFEEEEIRARDGSPKGLDTITKYKLDRVDLDHKRLRQLKRLFKVVKEIDDARIAEGGRGITDPEKALLRRFAQPDYPFSLMFSIYLARNGYL